MTLQYISPHAARTHKVLRVLRGEGPGSLAHYVANANGNVRPCGEANIVVAPIYYTADLSRFHVGELPEEQRMGWYQGSLTIVTNCRTPQIMNFSTQQGTPEETRDAIVAAKEWHAMNGPGSEYVEERPAEETPRRSLLSILGRLARLS